MDQALVDVAVPAPLPRALTYLLPARFRDVAPGQRVVCTLGARRIVGVVLAKRTGEPPERAKPILELLDGPTVPEDLLTFLGRLSNYYLAPIGEVMRLALPPTDREAEKAVEELTLFSTKKGVSTRKVQWVLPTEKIEESVKENAARILAFVRGHGALPLSRLEDQFGGARGTVKKLVEQGACRDRGARADPGSVLRRGARARRPAGAHRRAGGRRRVGPRRARRADGRDVPPPRRHGLGQDRGLSPGDRAGEGAEDRLDHARPRDRAHPAARRTLPRALRRRGRGAPLRAHATRALRHVEASPERRARRRDRGPERALRADPGPRPRHRRRGARPVVQAGGGRSLQRAGHGDPPRAPVRGRVHPRERDPVARERAARPRQEGDEDHAPGPRARTGDAHRRDRRPPAHRCGTDGRSAYLDHAAPRDRGDAEGEGADDPLPEPARLRAERALRVLRRALVVPALHRRAHLSQAKGRLGPLPLVRVRSADADLVPEVQVGPHRVRGPRDREARGDARAGISRGADRPARSRRRERQAGREDPRPRP